MCHPSRGCADVVRDHIDRLCPYWMQDLVKETAAFYKKARKFYDALARQLVRQGHTLDIFACSLDQVLSSPYAAYQSFRSGFRPTLYRAG